MKIAIEKFWCVNYYKAQPYNMEHTLCVCYNSVHDQVGRKIIKFVNDKYKISPAKRLEHVTPEELDSAFLLSKNAVLDEIYKDSNNTHTVCVPYYKAAPYNISHTKIFQWRFSL